MENIPCGKYSMGNIDNKRNKRDKHGTSYLALEIAVPTVQVGIQV